MILPKLHLDFETFSEVDLKASGAFRYAEDPTTEILIFGFSIGDDEPEAVDMSSPDAISQIGRFLEWVERGARIGAHNAQFERVIWEKTGRFPLTPKPTQWDCTAARSRMLAMPGSLDGAALALKLGLRKDPRGDELIRLFTKPDKKRGRCFPADRPADFLDFMDYCRQDVRVEAAIDKILPPLDPIEAEAYVLDYKINDRGMPVNMDRVHSADQFVEEYSEELLKAATAISGCRPSQRVKTLEYLESRGHPLPNLQAATVEELATKKDLPEDLVRLLDYRIELSRAGTKKLKAIKSCVSTDGRIRGGFLFSAASTRRWSSTGVQMHNLQKPEGECHPGVVTALLDDDPHDIRLIFDRPLTVLAQSIRGFFESDRNFLVADYASVEPRGLAWSANEEWMLEAYRKGEDLYKVAASRVYEVHPHSVDGDQRFMGKQLVLGCGYGMGGPRFVETVKKFGKILTEDEAKEAVYGYRNSVPMITKMWRQVELACIRATRKWEPVKCGRFTMRPEILSNGTKVLFVDMPSGSIAYPLPFLGTEEWMGELRTNFNFYTPLGSSWIKSDTFGGSLVENIIQAICRDILRDGMIAADKAGFELVGHCHDEAIAEGEGTKEELAEFERLLCCSSPWAEGFPIGTEGFISKVYKK